MSRRYPVPSIERSLADICAALERIVELLEQRIAADEAREDAAWDG